MKKILFLSCAALLALGSCTSDLSDDGFVDNANSISFSAYTNKLRSYERGDVTLDVMKETGNKFGVVGYYKHNLYLGATGKSVAQDFSNGSTWEYSDKAELKFWPAGPMDFYAYFPYAGTGDAFEATNNTSNVMTIAAGSADKDVLFAYVGGQTQTPRVGLQFHHAFSKIQTLNITMPAEGTLYKSNTQVEVNNIEFINTATKGNVLVNKSGVASYSGNNTTRSKAETFTIAPATNTKDFITSADNAYLFATANTAVVTGTGKKMWDGTKNSGSDGTLALGGKLSTSTGLVCLKISGKVWQELSDGTKAYYVGSASSDGDIYIPLTGSKSATPAVAPFLAGKRYTININWSNNVGYTDEGKPILNPILFDVTGVEAWDDVTITITL